MNRYFLLSFLCFSGCWFACSGPPPQKTCASDDVCSKGEICENQACIEGCRTDTQCPTGYHCENLKCTNQVCKPNEQRDCYDPAPDTKGKGPCKGGVQLCKPDGTGWSPCYEQVVPVAEICDGTDNDCDGEIDENLICECLPGESKRCYTGAVGTSDKGLCRAGIQYCTTQRTWGGCKDQSLPRREICDGLDNDCNGLVDDSIDCTCTPGATRECYSGPEGTAGVGICQKGQQVCGTDRKWNRCFGQTIPDLEETHLCNGQDDNCDGSVDNVSGSQEPLKRLCYSGPPGSILKPCQQGVSTCTSKTWGPCVDEVIPQQEDCNGKDDDCNGKVDDLESIPCFTGKTGCTKVGQAYACKGNCNIGQKTCDKGQWTACQGETLAQEKDQCGDGIDNDCNGAVDDQCLCATGQKQACYNGPQGTRNQGACKDGEQVCANNQWGPCTNAVLPAPESCNGKDDDCDGTIDNIAEMNKACVDPQRKGECSKGITRCKEVQGQWSQVCEQTTQPSTTEVCNGKDDDCDGTVDNIPDLKQACLIPQTKGNCSQGQWLCALNNSTYEKVCQPIKPAKAEICNGEDDNCDGIVDNIGTPCIVTGKQGQCQYGRTLCQQVSKGGSLVWESTCQEAPALPEVCNGQDDDCNGKIDDIPDTGKACTDPTRKGACVAGKWACVTDTNGTQKVCVPTISPTAEVCNGLDDDCDGVPDNIQGVCAVTDPKAQGNCRLGARTCVYDTTQQAWTEQCKGTSATTETCNGLDDDCNGTIDDVAGTGTQCVVSGKLGICNQGVTKCLNGKIECVADNPTPLNETCNNVDDDCDGKIDNGIIPRVCQTACGKGTETCSAGKWINCTAQLPKSEGNTCNGQDDDCDGKVDNFGPCTLTTMKGNCALGEKRCNSQNQIECQPKYTPILEVDCNGIDDDCDGTVDENFAHQGKLCVLSAGNGTLGYMACVNGRPICSPSPNNESWLPPGTFVMGKSPTDPNSYGSELPSHTVHITRPFVMYRYEVMNSEYATTVGYNSSNDWLKNDNFYGCSLASCPAQNITWHMAALHTNHLSKAAGLEACYTCTPSDYATWDRKTTNWNPTCDVAAKWRGSNFLLCPGYRLPTEAEWEYAYRAGTTTGFYNNYDCPGAGTTACTAVRTDVNNTLTPIAWYLYNTPTKSLLGGRKTTSPQIVGQKLANHWFLHDMAGNVHEWVQDWYAASYPNQTLTDPLGPTSGSQKVFRGGSAHYDVLYLRSSFRDRALPSEDGILRHFAGVRPVRSLHQAFYCEKDDDCKVLVHSKHICKANTCIKSP